MRLPILLGTLCPADTLIIPFCCMSAGTSVTPIAPAVSIARQQACFAKCRTALLGRITSAVLLAAWQLRSRFEGLRCYSAVREQKAPEQIYPGMQLPVKRSGSTPGFQPAKIARQQQIVAMQQENEKLRQRDRALVAENQRFQEQVEEREELLRLTDIGPIYTVRLQRICRVNRALKVGTPSSTQSDLD